MNFYKEEYIKHIEEDLKNQGYVIFESSNERLHINEEYLCMPFELTEIPPKDLGEYLNAFTQYKISIRTLLSQHEAEKRDAWDRYSQAFDKKFIEISNGPKKYSEATKEKLANLDETVRPLYEKYRELEDKCELIKNNMKNLDDAIFLFSREISRRNMDYTQEKRTY